MKNVLFYISVLVFAFFVFTSTVSAEVLDNSETQTESGVDSYIENETEVQSEIVVDLSPLSVQLDALNSKVDNLSNYVIPDFYKDYIMGLLFNMSWSTDYLVVPEVIEGVQHYLFYYDLVFDSGSLVLQSYPVYDLYSIDGVVYQELKTLNLDTYPVIAYGSFTPYSSLYDSRFPLPTMEVVLIGLVVMFILFRKRVFT